MGKLKFAIVSVSKDEDFKFTDEDIQKANEVFPDMLFFKVVNSAGERLPVIYNRYLKKFRDEGGYDYVIFVHSDAKFDIPELVGKLGRAEGNYDIIGLCGCRELDTLATPLNWYVGSQFKPHTRYGFVSHGELKDAPSFFNQSEPTIENIDVAAIDGVCIVFMKTALATDISFDERFVFDQYDTDLSLEATVKRNMRLGVVVEKTLKHYSVGKSILSKRFLVGEIELRKKWNLQFPKKLMQRMGAVQ